MSNREFKIRRASTILVVLLAVLPAFAGDLDLDWNPSDGADGYNLYQGLSSGSYGDPPTDVGNVTSFFVDGLADCTTHFFAVTAYNAAGESSYSNETSSFPDPRISTVSPSSAEQDRSLDLVLSGMNFQDGAVVEFSDPGITIHSVTVNSCSELVVGVTVGSGANPGPVDITVRLASNAWGTAVGAFTVEPAVAPEVSSTDPSDGATGVSIACESGRAKSGQSAKAPSARVSFPSRIKAAGLAPICVPSPSHSPHQPRWLLNEKLCGVSGSKLRPHFSHARCWL